MKYVPKPHHSAGIDWMVSRHFAALWVDMGFGKTGVSAYVLNELFDRVDISRALVIGTPRIAGKVWNKEFNKWDEFEPLAKSYYHITAEDLPVAYTEVIRKGQTIKVMKLVNTRQTRAKLYQNPAQVFTIHYDLLGRLAKLFGDKWPYDCVVMDESSMVSNQDTTRFRALRRVRGYITHLYQLTGTPAANGLEKLFSQVYLMDGGKRLGRTLGDFRAKFMQPIVKSDEGRVYKWGPRPGAREQIYELVLDICLNLDASEWAKDLPPRIMNIIPVTLPHKARELYNRIERDYIARLEGGGVVEAASAAVLGNKLMQICNGNVYDDEHGAHVVHTEKLEVLAELKEATAGPLLMAYWYDHDRQAIKKKFKKAVDLKEDDDFEDNWNAGQMDFGMLQPASGGHGLNLQEGGSNAVWFGPIWNLEYWLQFNKRLHRSGQKADRVVINVLVVEDSIEEDVMAGLEAKEDEQDALLNAVKRRINKLTGKAE